MARVHMITRTVTSTKVTAMVVDITAGTTYSQEFEVARTYKDEEKLLKAVKAIGETATVKVVAIQTSEEVETLYGMSEQQFIEFAEKLPRRKTAENKDENAQD